MNLQNALLKRLKRFRKRLRRLQTDPSPENIHDFRIACREVLACDALFKKMGLAKRWMHCIKDALDAIDSLRDLQLIHKQLLQQQLVSPCDIQGAIEKPLRKANRHWLNYAPTLQNPDFSSAMAAIEKSLTSDKDISKHLQVAFQKQWKKALYHTLKSLLAADASDLKSLHRLRIRFKKLRYLMELLENDLSLSLHRDTLKQWQEKLGGVQDFFVMARLTKKLGLPILLQQDFLCRADDLAQDCIAQRAALAQFLLLIDDQVRALP
jgi:CHAD domain-containing protein